VYAAGYPALRRAAQRASAQGVTSIDLSGAFDARRQEIFLDYCHVTEPGNEIIGRAIYATLRESLAGE
jgi:N-acetyl-gamma-glutamylphosphate reductase